MAPNLKRRLDCIAKGIGQVAGMSVFVWLTSTEAAPIERSGPGGADLSLCVPDGDPMRRLTVEQHAAIGPERSNHRSRIR